MDPQPNFDAEFLTRFQQLLRWRRDVRRFSPQPMQPGTLERLIEAASLAPSVGLSEPWRFVIVDDPKRRLAVKESFSQANQSALAGYEGEKAKLYAGLKLEGFDAPAHLAVYCHSGTEQGSGLGRMTMPETAEYSVVSAIQIIWLLARAQGIGMGWVSILEPQAVSRALDVPDDWKLVAYLCLGYPQQASLEPELAQHGWEKRGDPLAVLLRR